MATRDEPIDIAIDGQHIAGTLITPATVAPGILFVHGWRGTQQHYRARAHAIAELGCTCLTFDLRGHGETEPQRATITREHSLRDMLAAYDLLAARHGVDRSAIGLVGSSYGAYLAAILTTLRPVRWLGLRAPALYKDEDWDLAKAALDRNELNRYRRAELGAEDNRALRACAAFTGDVLLVESEHDDVVPAPVLANYRTAFRNAHSITYRVIAGADHGLSDAASQQSYTQLLTAWAQEMGIGSRAARLPMRAD